MRCQKKVHTYYLDLDRCSILEFLLYVSKVNRSTKNLAILETKHKQWSMNDIINTRTDIIMVIEFY